ncbi:MAG: hypothetical protein AAFV86_15105 [Pseudomonadota bacterium]
MHQIGLQRAIWVALLFVAGVVFTSQIIGLIMGSQGGQARAATTVEAYAAFGLDLDLPQAFDAQGRLDPALAGMVAFDGAPTRIGMTGGDAAGMGSIATPATLSR